jgi:hypothetical protein
MIFLCLLVSLLLRRGALQIEMQNIALGRKKMMIPVMRGLGLKLSLVSPLFARNLLIYSVCAVYSAHQILTTKNTWKHM